MPVLVVPADTALGVPLVEALRRDGAEVRAYATGAGDVRALRAVGAFVAVGDLDDEGRLDAAMTDAHTVVALHADPLVASEDALATHLHVALTAAHKAGVARLVVRSVPGADVGEDPLRRACASVEERLADLPLPTVVVRTSLVDTTALRDALASQPPPEDVDVGPLAVGDVVDALVALDAARGTRVGHATFRLQGPARPLRRYLDHVGQGMVGRVYTPAGRVPLLLPSLRTPWVEPDDDATADLLDFADLSPRPLAP